MAEVDFDYRSINRKPTALGIERKLCIFGVMLALIRFHIPAGWYPLLESVAVFAVWWTLIFALTK